MRLTRLDPMIETRNLSQAIEWYQQTLGYDQQDHLPELGWVSLIRDDVRIMLVTRMSQQQYHNPAFTGSFYLYTDDVDQWWEKLKNQVSIEYPIETFSYGMREFAIRDLNGYLIQFGTYAAE